MRDGPPDDEHFDVWPENWRAVTVFAGLTTQWFVGMSGPVGLRYESLPFVFEVHGVDRADWPELFEQIRACEGEALRYFAEKRNG